MRVKWKFPSVQKREKGERYFCAQRSGNPAIFTANHTFGGVYVNNNNNNKNRLAFFTYAISARF